MSTTTYNIVYKTTNLVNNKIYIGIHSTNDINDGYLGSGSALSHAIKKYGKENFVRKIIHVCHSRDIAAAYESSIVTEDFVRRRDTYNAKPGGLRKKNGKSVITSTDLESRALSEKQKRRLVASYKYKL